MNIDNLGICHLAVGQTIDRFKGTLMDGWSIDIENNITTYVIMNGLNEKKIKAFTEGKITFSVAEVDDIMLVLLEIEKSGHIKNWKPEKAIEYLEKLLRGE